MKKETVYPEWVQQQRIRGTTVKKRQEIPTTSINEPQKECQAKNILSQLIHIWIAILREKPESGPTEMRDQLNDDLTLIEKYVFRGISHL